MFGSIENHWIPELKRRIYIEGTSLFLFPTEHCRKEAGRTVAPGSYSLNEGSQVSG